MKKISTAHCRNQSIKRFLSPQPSNIPPKKPRKTEIKIGPKSRINSVRRVVQNEENCDGEMELLKTNVVDIVASAKEPPRNSSDPRLTQDKFDWNSFVRDPGEMNESLYPVTLNTFKTMTHCMGIVKRILEDINVATGLDFLNDQLMQERALKNYYKQFYEQPQIREVYKLETKACPVFVKKKIMEIPMLENAGALTSVVQKGESVQERNEAEHIQSTVQVEQPNKQKRPETVEAQTTKMQNTSVPQQSNSPVESRMRNNLVYLSKKTVFTDSNFLLTHIKRHVQQVEQHQTILERIECELLQRTKNTQATSVLRNSTTPMTVEDSMIELSDITVSSQNSTKLLAAKQRLKEANELFFREYNKSNTLAYAVRFHRGLKHQIIDAILKMSFEEFKTYTKIYDAPEIYENIEILSGYYDYAIKEHKLWPINLYMQISDLIQFLKLKGIIISENNLEDISPMLLHWSELSAITNFDEIMRWDYYRCKGEKFNKNTNLDACLKAFYEKCWLHNIWVRKAPIVLTKSTTTTTESNKNFANENLTIPTTNESMEAAHDSENSAQPTLSNNSKTAAEPAAMRNKECTELECTNAVTEKVPETAIKVEAYNDEPTLPVNASSVGHVEEAVADEEMQDLNENMETLNIDKDKISESGSNGEAAVAKQNVESALVVPVNSEAAVTTMLEVPTELSLNNVRIEGTASTQSLEAEVEPTLLEITTDLNPNIDTVTKTRVGKATDLYFSEVEKSCTLPYLLRFHGGLKSNIIATILKMSLAEFKQYTHIYDAAEIYNDPELLKRCYEYTTKKPQVWPINLYMCLIDLFQYLKSKGVTLPEISLKHISPKFLHWHDLVSITNYDYISIWDYYRCTGKKINRKKTLLDPYRQTFYEKCWFYDMWQWHTPRVLPTVLRLLANEPSVAAVAEDNENATFERLVVLHAVEEEQVTRGTCVPQVVANSRYEKETILCAIRPTTVDAEIQTTQGLLGENVSTTTQVDAGSVVEMVQNPMRIKEEKLVPLNKLQFILTNDEENYECVQAPEDIVDLDASLPTSESQEQPLLPLSNSESLVPQDINALLASGSVDMNDLHNSPLATEECENQIMLEQESDELNLQQSEELQESSNNTETETNLPENVDLENEHQQEEQEEQTLLGEQYLQTVEVDQAENTQQILAQPQSKSQPKPQQDQPMVVIGESKQTQAQETRKTDKETSQPNVLGVVEQTPHTRNDLHKPVQQQQHTDETSNQTKSPQMSQKEHQPFLMKVKAEKAKISTQQRQSGIATAMTRIIEEGKAARESNPESFGGQRKSTNQQEERVELSLQQQQQQQEQPHQEQKHHQGQEQKQQDQAQPKQEEQNTQAEKQRKRQQEQQQQKQQQQHQKPNQLQQQPTLDTHSQQNLQTVEQQSRNSNTQPQQIPRTEVQRKQQQTAKSQSQQKLQIVQQQQQQMEMQTDQQQLPPAQTCLQKQSQLQLQQEEAIEGQLQALLGEPPTAAQTETATKTLHCQEEQQQQEEQGQEEQQEEQIQEDQQQLSNTQSQLILQRTHTQVQEQLMLRPSGALPQNMATTGVPPLAKLSKHSTTKTKTVKTKTVTTRKLAKNSDYVPQLTHAFQPLPIALNTKKPTTYSAPSTIISLPSASSQIAVNLQQNQLAPVVAEQIIAGGNVVMPTSNTNALLLTLPASISSSSSSSSSNSSYVYTLSGDSTFFNSSELLKVIENYQLQRSQQQQQQQQQQQSQQSQLQLQRQQVFEQPSTQLVFGQSQMVQLQQSQFEQASQQQQLELYQQSQIEQQQQQQQQHPQPHLQISQQLAVERNSQHQQQQQHRQISHALVLDANSQQQQQQQLQISQPLVLESNFPQQQYQVVPSNQPGVYQLLDVTQAPHGCGEQQQHKLYTQLQGDYSHHIQIEREVPEDIPRNQVQQFVNPDQILQSHYITEIVHDNFMEDQKHYKSTSTSKEYPHYTIEMLQHNTQAAPSLSSSELMWWSPDDAL